jgi:transposase-like protein
MAKVMSTSTASKVSLGYAKVRLVKFRGVSKNTFYLHLKECEFRFNYRHHDLYEMLLKITKQIIFC